MTRLPHLAAARALLRWALTLALLAFALGPTPAARAAPQAVACDGAALIAAIEAANASGADDTLDLAANCLYVLAWPHNDTLGPSGLPVIADAATAGALTINGHGARLTRGYKVWLPLVLNGTGSAAASQPAMSTSAAAAPAAAPAPDFRLLAVAAGGELTLEDLTLANGSLPNGNGGAIYSEGTLVISDTTFSGNSAGAGGGVFSTGALTVTASTFSDNTAAGGGGGINSTGDLTVNDSTFDGNAAGLGDSVLVAGGTSGGSGNDYTGEDPVTCPSFPLLVGASDEAGLIAALHCANSSPSSEVINLTNSTYTFTGVDNNWQEIGPNALPVVVATGLGGALTINGNGATLARSSAGGTPEFRLLLVAGGGDLTLNDVTVQNGHLTGANGGGIYNDGTLRLADSTITGNAAYFGGGVSSATGTIVISNSTFSDNTSERDGAGLASGYNLTLSGSLFTHNVAGKPDGQGSGLGGGIVSGGAAVITATQFISNTAYGNAAGGGLCIVDGNLTISDSTIADNWGDGAGGGIFIGGATALVRNVTITNNRAVWGGGLWNGGTVTVLHSTISGNSTTANNSAGDAGGGGIMAEGGTLTLGHTIVAGNTAFNGVDISKTVTSAGYNLIGNTAGLTLTGSTTGNLLNAGPVNLGPLQDNGGPTLTRALLAGSVALDAGNPSFAPPPSYDQRGVGYPRVANGTIDIGAFEKQP